MARLLFASFLNKRAQRSRGLLRALWFLEGAVAWLVVGCARLLPVEAASRAGSRLMSWLGPRMAKSQVIRRNLEIAFPELPTGDVDRLLSRVWAGIGAIFGEYPHLGRITGTDFERHVEVVRQCDVEALRSGARPAVFVSGHFSNWEVAIGTVVALGIPVVAFYAPLQNPWMNRLMLRFRGAMGATMMGRDESTRDLLRHLREGRSIGFLLDQRVDSGEPLPFFGHDKPTSLTAARLALRFDCDMIPVRVERLGGVRFRVSFYTPIRPDPAAGDERAQQVQMTREMNALFERWIRERPEQWFCTKRRWAKDIHKAAPGEKSV